MSFAAQINEVMAQNVHYIKQANGTLFAWALGIVLTVASVTWFLAVVTRIIYGGKDD